MAQAKLTHEDRKILEMFDRVDRLIFARVSKDWEDGMRHLAGYSMCYLVALLESRPQQDIARFHPAGFADWLSVAPPACRYPLQRLALRAQVGPEWGQVPDTDDYDLLNAREFVNKIIWKADARARERRNWTQRERRRRARAAQEQAPTPALKQAPKPRTR